MSIRSNCPCDIDGICPYDAVYFNSCEYWCGAEETDDNFLYYDDPDEWMNEVGFDPYLGCYTDDC